MTTTTDTLINQTDNSENLSGWQDRIKQRLKALGMTQETLAKKIGITRSAICHYLAGRRIPSLSQFSKLAKVLESDPGWLQYGTEEKPSREKISEFISSMHPLPLLSWEEAPKFRGTHRINPTDIKEWVPNYFTQANSFAGLRIKGDAMTSPNGLSKSFHEGDIIVVDYRIGANPGDFVLVHTPDTNEVTFKQYVVDGGVRYLKPLNPQYPTIPVTDKHNLIAVFSYCISPKTGTDKELSLNYDPEFWGK